MSRTATLALALLLAASGWLGAAAQAPQQNQARTRPATQGAVDDLRADVAAISRELASVARALSAATDRLRAMESTLTELRMRAGESRDRIAEAGVRLADTSDRVNEIATAVEQLRARAGVALVPFVLSANAGPMSDATRDAAQATCDAIAGSTMTGQVVYAERGASIGSSQAICRLQPR